MEIKEYESFKELFKDARQTSEYLASREAYEFTEKIFQLMKDNGISKSELARLIGTKPSYITKILRGDINFTILTIAKLVKALDADFFIDVFPVKHGAVSQTPATSIPVEIKYSKKFLNRQKSFMKLMPAEEIINPDAYQVISAINSSEDKEEDYGWANAA